MDGFLWFNVVTLVYFGRCGCTLMCVKLQFTIMCSMYLPSDTVDNI